MSDGNILVLNSMIIVKDYEPNTQLEKRLSVWKESIHAYSFTAMRVVENIDGTLDAVFPKSLPMYYLSKAFPEKKVIYVKPKFLEDSLDIKCLYEPKDSLQTEALSFLSDNWNRSQLLLHLRTDSGKTFIAIKFICEEKRKAIIIAHNEVVLTQWISRILEFTNISEDEIGIIQGKKSINKVTGKEKIFIAIHRTLTNIVEEDSKRLFSFVKENDIDIKIIDECHLEMMSTFVIDSFLNIPTNIYLTATAERAKYDEDKVFGYIVPVKDSFGKGSKDISDIDKQLKTYFINYTTNISENREAKLTTRYGFDLAKWAAYTLDFSEEIGEMILYYLKKIYVKLKTKDVNVAIMLKSLDQCRKFELFFESKGIEVGQFNTIYKDKKTRHLQLEKGICLTTDKSFGTAVDSSIDVLFNLLPIGNRPGTLQMVGRLRSTGKLIYYDFTDNSIGASVKMQKKRRTYLKKNSKKFIEWTYNT